MGRSNIPFLNPAFLVSDGSCPLAADFPIFFTRSGIVSRRDAPSRSPDDSSSVSRSWHVESKQRIGPLFLFFFFFLHLDSRFLSHRHDRWTPRFRGVALKRGSKEAWQESWGRNLFSLSSKSSRTLAGDARAKPPRVMLGSDWSLRRGASVATTRAKAESPPPPRPAPPCPPPWSATGW